MIDFHHFYAFYFMKYGLNLDPHCWVLVECSLFVLRVLRFSRLWSILTKYFEFFVFLQVWFILGSGLGFGLFFGSNQWSLAWFGLWSNQRFRVNLLVKWLRSYLANNIFGKGFYIYIYKGMFSKNPLSLFWTILFQRKWVFIKQSLKNN